MPSIARTAIKKLRPSLRSDLKRLVRFVALHPLSRRGLNLLYHVLSPRQKETFHANFAKVFREAGHPSLRGAWSVFFAGRHLRLPLDGKESWLEWDLAVSLLGHEVEIKQTYETILKSPQPPKLVFDIGANYGTHSLLFLSHGVPTLSFEPNANCHPYFQRLCTLNHVDCQIETLAFGSKEEEIELCFPENDTWYGTTNPQAIADLSREFSLTRKKVQQTTLDQYVRQHACRPELLKIDTEGSELQILQGGLQTLEACRPLVIFESWPTGARTSLFDLFTSLRYKIYRLPLLPDSLPAPLTKDEFCELAGFNFIAMPREKLL